MLRQLKWLVVGWVLVGVLSFAGAVVGQDLGTETPFVAWSPNGQYLAVGNDTSVRILDAETLEALNVLDNLEVQEASAAWSPDGNRLAIVDGANVAIWQQPWDIGKATLLTTYQYYADRNPAEPSVSVAGGAWSPDGTKIASIMGGIVDIWDPETGTRLLRIAGEFDVIPDIVWHDDGRIAIGDIAHYAYLLDSETGAMLKGFNAGLPVVGEVPPGIWAVDMSPSGNELVTGNGRGEILIWNDTSTSAQYTSEYALVLGTRDEGHTDFVFTLDWSPTGQFIASGSGDGTVRIWDAASGEHLGVIEIGVDAQVNSVAWSPDGSRLAYGNSESGVSFFDAKQLPGYAPMAEATPAAE